eukprot:m.225519 g.225519  ORF g.225519 m.225519 type:complete len:264 (-) comp15957_c4_seq15:1095-1886(-)
MWCATRTLFLFVFIQKVGATWKLTWSDEFDGGVINTSNWQVYDNQTHGPKELELYTKDEVYVQDGKLILRTQLRQRMYGTKQYNYTSGWVQSEHLFSQQFGRFDVSAHLPDWHCPGIWPAHWLMPEPETSKPPDVCWPVGGEIDIMEMVGNSSDCNICGTFHWAKECGKDLYKRGTNGHFPGSNVSSGYHVFSVQWSTEGIIWLVDNMPYHWRSNENATIPQDPFYIILNTAISPWEYNHEVTPKMMPQYHSIDYVRVYKWET